MARKPKKQEGPQTDQSLQVVGYVYDERTKWLKIKDSELADPVEVIIEGKLVIPMKKILRMTGHGKEMPCEGCE